MQNTPGAIPDPARTNHAAMQAMEEYERTERADLLDRAIAGFAQAVEATPAGRPERAERLSNLGAALRTRSERGGDGADLEEAISVGRQAVQAAQADHPSRGDCLTNLGNSLARRFERSGDGADLEEAISIGRQAVEATPARHPNRAGYLSNLGMSLLTRFESTDDGADLDAAITAGRQAVEATPVGHPDRAMMLSNLGMFLLTRFERGAVRADADEAIRVGRVAVEATPAGHPKRPMYLSNLGTSLARRFESGGDGADLDEAISVVRRAVQAIPAGHPNRATMLSNLGNSLVSRFHRDGDGADLEEAISVGRQAVETTPAGHPNRAMHLSTLGSSLRTRSERGGDGADLEEAISVGRQAVEATPAGHPNRAIYLSKLSTTLLRWFHRGGDGADLEEAISVGRQAVEATPADHPDRARYLSNLGATLLRWFESGGDGADLEEAISVGRQAVEATPADHPDRAGHLSNLGNALCTRFERDGHSTDLDAAVSQWLQASEVVTATPLSRLTATRSLVRATVGCGQMSMALEGYSRAVKLLPVVVWHGLDRALREEHLSRWAGLTVDAAACAILVGEPESAVELLEQGRSLLWTQILDLRSDLTDLAERAPSLARRLDEIRTVLDAALPEASPSADDGAANAEAAITGVPARQEQAIAHRASLAREWDALLQKVRALDGFEHFLAPVPYTQLRRAASGGPVVVVNASHHGCHALIVTSDHDIQVVPLPGLTLNTAIDQANTLLGVLSRTHRTDRPLPQREKDRHAVLDLLDWLWDTITEPVLTALARTTPHADGAAWPRVWWCPTGPLTMLPLHAAGHHPRLNTPARERVDCVSERVISSYTPTLTALLRAQRTSVSPAGIRQLVVGMPTTPGQPDLPAVGDELKALDRYFQRRHFPRRGHTDHLVAKKATRNNVLRRLPTCSWLHMACHAYQHPSDPTRSGFALWDEPLTIADLVAEHLDHAELAFLSACQTATGSTRLLDEAIHLAAAMQLLGYRHILATMWTIADSTAPYIAASVYATLTKDGTPDPGRAAEALHHATESLRAARPAEPLLWAAYLHIGL